MKTLFVFFILITVTYAEDKVIFKPKNFKIEELVDPYTYLQYGERSWQFLDERAVRTLQWVRELLGVPLTVNNWHRKGVRRWSGLRHGLSDCDVYSERSQHSMGRSFDFVCQFNAQYVRDQIAEHWPKTGLGWSITLEKGVSWTHLDCRSNKMLVNYF